MYEYHAANSAKNQKSKRKSIFFRVLMIVKWTIKENAEEQTHYVICHHNSEWNRMEIKIKLVFTLSPPGWDIKMCINS